jgi:hypothetical protein
MVLFCATAEVLPLDVAFFGALLAAAFVAVALVAVPFAAVVAAGFFVFTAAATAAVPDML